MSNVCTHRGNILCTEPAVLSGVRCRYHGRRFTLEGKMIAMPEFEGVHDFPTPRDDLKQVALGRLGPLMFAGLDPAFPFDSWIAPVRERLAFLPFDRLAFDPASSRAYDVQASWALYCDNYLEGFHIPYVHSSLATTLDYGEYAVELERFSVVQLGIARPGEPAFALPRAHPDHGRAVAAYYYWLFPTTMFNVYPWGVSVNMVTPLAVDRTRVSFLPFVWDATKRDSGAGAGLDRVEREDEAIVESVQRGVRSRLYDRGRYSPAREGGVHHFHRLLAEFLGIEK